MTTGLSDDSLNIPRSGAAFGVLRIRLDNQKDVREAMTLGQ